VNATNGFAQKRVTRRKETANTFKVKQSKLKDYLLGFSRFVSISIKVY